MSRSLLVILLLAPCACERLKTRIHEATAPAVVDAGPPAAMVAETPVDAGPPAAAPSDGVQRIEVTLHGPLEREVAAQVPPAIAPALSLVMQRLTLWWMAPSDARPGDTLVALYELPPGHEPMVRALRYTSQKTGRTYAAYAFQPEGAPYVRYYTADGQELEERLRDSPVESYEQITSFLKDGRHHQGVDFKCAVGTPLKMPFDGTILRKNWNWHGNGNCIEVVDSKTGHHAKFLHLSPLPGSLAPGQHVKRGQEVASTGNTGHTTAPHLHYQLESGSGSILDPFKVHETYRTRLGSEQMPAFKSTVDKLDRQLGK